MSALLVQESAQAFPTIIVLLAHGPEFSRAIVLQALSGPTLDTSRSFKSGPCSIWLHSIPINSMSQPQSLHPTKSFMQQLLQQLLDQSQLV